MKLKSAAPIGDSEQIRKEWLDRLDRLLTDIEQWTADTDWVTRRIDKPMEESPIGEYRAPVLLMQNGIIRLMLEPTARFTASPGIEGVAEFYRMPAYDDMLVLFLKRGEWRMVSKDVDSPSSDKSALRMTKKNLLNVLEKLSRDH